MPNLQPPRARSVLSLDDVSRSFEGPEGPIQVVSGVSFELPRGATVAITGRSGSGKSTLLNLCAGLDSPTSGRLLVEGEDLDTMGDAQLTLLRRHKVGLVFQFFNLLSTLTLRENVMLPGRLAGRPIAELRREANELLDLMELSHRASSTPEVLSGGEMQRCAVARALIHRPALVLADEPTGNLDSHSAARVLDLLVALPAERGAALLLVTHSPEVAARADRHLRMSDGEISEEDAVAFR
ncbi:MAG TPA: ABC transporter ATP-binding protein [Armatimonadota bacterium]|jgi:ABC-type lipoprotein export system ATPase subunit